MEGQREYLRTKDTPEAECHSSGQQLKLKEKVGKLMKKRRLAKMQLVLDTSTVRDSDAGSIGLSDHTVWNV